MTIFAIVLGVFYFIVGAAKLAGAKPLAEQFDEFGLGQNVMRAVGAAEVAAAVGLQIDRVDVLAAGGMILMMLGALFNPRSVNHPPTAMGPALVVLVGSAAFLALSL